jgi:hypothetical protein
MLPPLMINTMQTQYAEFWMNTRHHLLRAPPPTPLPSLSVATTFVTTTVGVTTVHIYRRHRHQIPHEDSDDDDILDILDLSTGSVKAAVTKRKVRRFYRVKKGRGFMCCFECIPWGAGAI